MMKTIARRMLTAMGKRYDYDVTYMNVMLDQAPRLFFKFARLTDIARHHEAAPTTAVYAAKLVAAMAEDCGPCVQIVASMAREEKVPSSDIAAVLKRDTNAMSTDAALGFRFAEAIVYRLQNEDEVRDAVRQLWGEQGVVELSVAIAIARVFPMTKAGMGHAKTCRQVRVDGAPVDVVKRAA